MVKNSEDIRDLKQRLETAESDIEELKRVIGYLIQEKAKRDGLMTGYECPKCGNTTCYQDANKNIECTACHWTTQH